MKGFQNLGKKNLDNVLIKRETDKLLGVVARQRHKHNLV